MSIWFHLLILYSTWPCVWPFRICAFNAQHFGDKKVSSDNIFNIVVKIVQRCDIFLLQEVHDPKGNVVSKLMAALNRAEDVFLAVSSPPIGRKSYTEQYVFIYRSFRIRVTDQYKYEDDDPAAPDVFAREPYVIRFALESAALKDLAIIPQHTEPEKAHIELDALYDVFMDVRRRWRCKNIILMGDFNAGCKYLSKKRTKSLRLYTDPDVHWLISDRTDTTVKESTSCPYDRILVYGQELTNLVASAGIYNFTRELDLSEAEALKVSDHYPVEMDLNLVLDGCGTLLPSLTLLILSLSAAFDLWDLL
ncbi:deoxyribonuclease-1-like 1 [Hyla sarda]|uniref:deoxyribonuclease-1-like 1 n=1 Tax=Hyla sarda TaxID=327740 RepID=UPI0024C46BBA|nr:deoxyribonuclease-1-like 1 [Hyla sarda]XP_056397098.1 deoxyribonuclease-1-like 1 [Hyla sarda]XP_056397099.1 deoxyribonuclease-1-like 1 [Hyla sarda]